MKISKSSFIRGMQCEKSLFLHFFKPELRDEISVSQQAIFDTGHSVGELAQQRFPGGVDASRGDHGNYSGALAYTRELIRKGQKVIYEAAFSNGETLCYMDILVKEKGGWHAYEVKASTAVKEYQVLDVAFQYWVIKGSGLPLTGVSLVHLNNQYVRRGELDIMELFSVELLTDVIIPMQEGIPVKLKALKLMLEAGKVPEVEIGPHCSNPFGCDFMGHCWKDVPDYSVFNILLIGERAFDLLREGIVRIADIPDDFSLSESQQMQVQAEKTGEVFRDQEALDAFKSGLEYPLYFMDFETFMPAVPMYDETRPYQMLPFQYSLHVTRAPGKEPEHFAFLGTPPADPREEFIRSLIKNIGNKGSIITWNQGFETARLNEIARDLPGFEAAIAGIVERVTDLMSPFQHKHFYTPEMKGSYSIKSILPALVPELSYKDLEIQEGGTASLVYSSLYSDPDPASVVAKRNNLLRYCALDTMSMVKILEKL
jgi:hypothetical protein